MSARTVHAAKQRAARFHGSRWRYAARVRCVRLLLAPAVTALAGLGMPPRDAHATWSITGADSDTGMVGSAGASCVPYEVIVIHAAVPGRGAFDIQAGFDDAARDEALALLADGATPDEVIAAVSDVSAHPGAPEMQYGVVDVLGASAAYTGPEAQPWAGHQRGSVGALSYSAQGNILTSPAVVAQAASAFETAGCDLPDRLVRALEAGAAHGEGDNRCTPEGLPARSAFLEVDRPGEAAGSWLRISIPDVTPDDPLVGLRSAYDAWRLEHPCPEGAGGNGGGGGAGGAGSEPPTGATTGDEGSCAMAPARPPATATSLLSGVATMALAAARRARRGSAGATPRERRPRGARGR